MGYSDTESIRSEITSLAYELRAGLSQGNLVSESWDNSISSSDPRDFEKEGVTSFNSTESLHLLPEWNNVTAFVKDFAGVMAKSMDDTLSYDLLNMWTTIYPPGAFVPEHVHSHSTLSGVFYAKAEANCGETVFGDPAWVAKTMSGPSMKGKYPEVSTKYRVTPEPGLMLLFPAWLPHRSLINQSQDDRIIISFNMKLTNS
jgi:uncharacterized protein (TIGR02466 family)